MLSNELSRWLSTNQSQSQWPEESEVTDVAVGLVGVAIPVLVVNRTG